MFGASLSFNIKNNYDSSVTAAQLTNFSESYKKEERLQSTLVVAYLILSVFAESIFAIKYLVLASKMK